MGTHGREALQELDYESWEYASDLGKEKTAIIDIYMMTFELAVAQLEEKKK